LSWGHENALNFFNPGGKMKKTLILMILFIAVGSLLAETLIHTYRFDMPEMVTKESYTEILYENCYNMGEEGNPLLPYFSTDILLPQGQEIENIRILNEEYFSIIDNITIQPASRKFPIYQKAENYEVEPNENIYNSYDLFPDNMIDYVSTQFLAGHSIGSFLICPVIYQPAAKEARLLKEIELEITTRQSDRIEVLEQFLHDSKIINQRITKIVENPEILSTYNYQLNRDEECDILLITNNALLPAFQDYMDFKESTGYFIEAITTEDIYTNYTGQDNQEKIRNCIIDYYLNFGIIYVILGGDSAPNIPAQDVIPHRGLFALDDNNIPADMYYACLDRGPGAGTGPDWNNDGDNQWGEPGEYDLYSEVGIGRICVDDAAEIQNFTNKLTMYQDSPVIDDTEKALMIGEELNNNPWTFGGDYKDEILYGSANHGFTTVGISANFSVSTLYDRDMTWDKYDLYDQFNITGINLLNHLGHSSPTYNMKMYNSDITTSNLTNDGITRGFVIGYSQGCYNGSFDNWHWSAGYGEDCFAEKITTLETGEVACIANSRFGWYIPGNTNSPSQYLDRQFYDAIFGENITQIGFVNSDSKEDNVSYFTSDEYMRWAAYEENLFGDPSMDIWTAAPVDIVASYLPSVLLGTEEIVFQTDTPFARVGLMQNSELIGRGVADEFGNLTIDLSEPITTSESITLSIIGHNKNRLSNTISIIADQPYVIYESHQINDAACNGNGLADFGESILLDVTLNNIGNIPADDVVALLTSEDEYITITDDSQNYNTINAQSTAVQTDAFAFDIAGNIPDQHEITFNLEITGTGRDTWYSDFTIIANAPHIVYEEIIIDDSAGNDNGMIDPGETVALSIPTVNQGHILSPEATAVLNSTNQLVTITNNSVFLGEMTVGDTEYAMYELTADETIAEGTPVTLNYEITAGDYLFEYAIVVSIGLLLEDFETGDFSSFSWEFSGNADWTIDSSNPYEGSYCGKSGVIDHNQTSSLILTLDIMCDSEISFYRKTSCEEVGSSTGNYYDYLVFFVDGVEMDKWAGETPWGEVIFDVTAGEHTLEWMYHKDVGVVGGADCVWVDYIILPPIADPTPPNFVIDPLSIEKEMEVNTIETEILTLSNDGGGVINYEIEISEPLDWIALGTTSGSLTPYEYNEIDVVFDTNELEPGDYNCDIIINTAEREQFIVPVSLTVTATDADSNAIPAITELIGNYPNPFNPETVIKYGLKTDTKVLLEIYNLRGQKVKTLINDSQSAGYHQITWNGRDKTGKQTASGVYFYIMKTDNFEKTRKMILLK
jgi:hypothetical protein